MGLKNRVAYSATILTLLFLGAAAAWGSQPVPQVVVHRYQPVGVLENRVTEQAAGYRRLQTERDLVNQQVLLVGQKKQIAALVTATAKWENRLRAARIKAAKKKIAPYVRPHLPSIKDYALQRVGSYQFRCLNSLWQRESGWKWNAYNRSSGAYGIPQALPGSKMASAGADWRTNPYTQIRWGLGYIASVYGSPCAAWAHSQSSGWYVTWVPDQVDIGKSYIGVPYLFGGTTPDGWDCSGFTQYVFAKAGVTLPRTSLEQYAAAEPVSSPRPGDLVFFGVPVHHVGIYLGAGMMVDAERTGGTQIRPLWASPTGFGRF